MGCLRCVNDALLLTPHFKMLYTATLPNSIGTYFQLCLTSLITPLSRVLFLSETLNKPLSPAVRHSETPDCQSFDGDLRQMHIRLNQIRRSGDLCNIAASFGVVLLVTHSSQYTDVRTQWMCLDN